MNQQTIGNALSFTKRSGTSGLTYSIEDSTDLGVADPCGRKSPVLPT